jgi:hypothetical protein
VRSRLGKDDNEYSCFYRLIQMIFKLEPKDRLTASQAAVYLSPQWHETEKTGPQSPQKPTKQVRDTAPTHIPRQSKQV